MSEQEKKTAREGASAVVVESAGSRHKQPYRPTELQDDSRDLHTKRSKAPAVPSVAEELKTLSEDNPNENVDTKDRKESERAIKHHVSKKLSSSKKKGSAAEVPIPDVELGTQMKDLPSPSQPIPPGVASVSGISVIDKVPEPKAVKKEDEDNIIEDTQDVRTAAEEKHDDWENVPRCSTDKDSCTHAEGDKRMPVITNYTDSAYLTSKKGVSWNDDDQQQYLPKLHLNEMGDESRDLRLERKSSLGPCKSRTMYEGPSGISLYVPRKCSSRGSNSNVNLRRSGINLTMSKKCLPVESKCDMMAKKSSSQETRAVKVDPHVPYVKILCKLRGKYITVLDKFKNVLNLNF